jgi:myo-inositol-1(or 4)-monophosphatase
MPVWGTLIGLTRRGRPVYGMMHQPYLRERFSGDGEAATYEGPAGRRTLRTRPCASLSEATIATTHPLLMKPKERRRFTAVESLTRLSRYGGDCYAYAMLASGLIDIVVEAGLKPYDIVALIPVIEGAGGVVTTWDGGDAAQGGAIVASGDRRVHEEALKLLAG